MDIRLEYNPYEGKFHSARVYDHRTPKGWVCISERLDNDAANGFIKYMSRSKTRMTVEQVKQQLSDWMWLHQ